MGQLDFKWDAIQYLSFIFPHRVFGLRELSRLSKIPKSSLQRKLRLLIKQELVKKVKEGYQANENSFWYRFQKRNYLLTEIYESGLVDYLEKFTCAPVMILFGSGAKGEYIQKSDLDIFLLAKERPLNLPIFEKKLKRRINILFKENFNQLSPELFNNIINGYKLSGYLKLK